MAEDKLPTGKIERASKFLKTGLKVGLNYAKHYTKKAFTEVSDEELEKKNAKELFESFASLKGSALKVAQMLSQDSMNLSSNFTEQFQKAQYSVPPMSAPMAIQTFKKSVGESPEKVFDKFNPNAVAAASLGQVHEAWKNGKKLAVKIQYPGVADSIKSDLKLMKPIAKQILKVSAEELEPYMNELETKLLEETNYIQEVNNSLEFRNACAELKNIVFPDYYKELCTDRVIVMDWLEGVHMKEFLSKNPTQEQKNQIAQNIWDFYEFQFHKINKINADPHPGNFLFRPDNTVGVIDFGCTKEFSGKVYEDYFGLANYDLYKNPEQVKKVFFDLEIFRPTDTEERINELLELFSALSKMIAKPYQHKTFYFGDQEFLEEINQMGKIAASIGEIRGKKDFLFVNRTFFGIFSLMKELDAHITTQCKYLPFLKYD
jgi:predicted unusual protein kinase regulating ubiquinone biosynthesis (AarF/ABC1/UbiB family)